MKYNLYIKPFNWQWRNIPAHKLREILTNQYSDLLKWIDEEIYSSLLLDLRTDKISNSNFKNLTYKKDSKVLISICKVNKGV